MVSVYASRLSEYPADVVRHALIRKTWQWFPTWSELERVCETLAGPRRHMLAALEAPAPDPEPSRRPATPEERARIQTLVDEMFPLRPRAERELAVDIALQGNCMRATGT
ncbi:hypothetical protein [Pontibaca methylaminivorans]|uniref:Uncharacterized protein n=1 Tax=Pontibaca methylaminivorans TaxID=515897 RepID=A0A1R3WA88_9RHOB|nr:hypothetical protein [Pontibaca methylaminivorans]SIT74710.1 hypothetical protein SAMN05421849_0202 [Pontibaca methylaminivorans]